MLLDYFLYIRRRNVSVKHTIGIDDNRRPGFTYIEAACTLGTHYRIQFSFLQFLLEFFNDCCSTFFAAGFTLTGFSLIGADENVLRVFHVVKLPIAGIKKGGFSGLLSLTKW